MELPFKPVFEPLGNQHDRAAFYCGTESLDRYLRQQASQDLRRRLAVTYVMLDSRSNKVAGYYTLTNYKIDVGELPPEIARRIPYPDVPATLIGRLAIDLNYQGHGLGRVLLMDALHRSLLGSYQVASLAVVVDAIDDTARSFYEHHDFIRSSTNSYRLFLPMATIQQLFQG